VGQFTGLFKELDNTEKKPTKAKTNKTAQTSAAKKTVEVAATTPAKVLQTAKAKPEAKKPISTAKTETPALMRGKRSHPDYTQAPAFVRKNTYKAVKIALLNDERGLDYSDLVEELLTAWLKNR
jgi:DNA-directed RNA polymerase sigma subunit (sigma70/sigma32)